MYYDVIVIGGGAAGLMAAAQAGKRGRRVLLIEHTNNMGEKIRISGGGRCNFTNIHASSKNYISANPHFAISALSRYTQHDFIKLVEIYNIAYHEKTLGQLFCDGPSMQIVLMLAEECEDAKVTILLNCQVVNVHKDKNYSLKTSRGDLSCESLVIATGGLSIPKMGATDFGYRIASQFGINIITPRPALVPLTVGKEDINFFKDLSGVSIASVVRYKQASFKENILFTHRGLSGPAILQISSYIEGLGEDIYINLLPEVNLKTIFLKEKNNKVLLSNFLKEFLPKRFVESWFKINEKPKRIIDYKKSDLEEIAESIHNFKVTISGNEGYAKAEVTAGGIDTEELSSKTMASLKVPGLFFIGEVVDVTGWLGGYNFQWAWSSGYAAGLHA